MEKYRKQLSFLSSGKINIFEKKLYGNSFFPLQMKIGEIDFRISFSRFKMDFILYYAKEGYCYNENLLDNIFSFFSKDASINSQVTGYIFPFNRIEALLRTNRCPRWLINRNVAQQHGGEKGL